MTKRTVKGEGEQRLREDLQADGVSQVWRWLEQVGGQWETVTPDTCDVTYNEDGSFRCFDQHGREHGEWYPIKNRGEATDEQIRESWEAYVWDAVGGYDPELDWPYGEYDPGNAKLSDRLMVGFCDDGDYWAQCRTQAADRYGEQGSRHEDRYRVFVIHFAGNKHGLERLAVSLYDAKEDQEVLSDWVVVEECQPTLESYLAAGRPAPELAGNKTRTSVSVELD